MAAPHNSGYLQATDPTKPRSDAAVPFRDIIPPPSHPRIAGIADHNALSWCESRRMIEAPAWLINRLDAKNLETPYIGFTSDGKVRTGLYHYAEDEGAPTEQVIAKAVHLLSLLPSDQKGAVQFGQVTDDAFRLWSNPELYMNPGGLRLDECSEGIQTAVHTIFKASFSPQGYEKVLGCCLTNGFLGHLVNGKKVLNEHSYNFRLFGTPSLSSPWGYTFFGHHLCLAVVFLGKRMVIGPTFMGAEPDRIDEGPHAGLRLFRTEELVSLKLMQGLPKELQDKATLSKGMDGNSLAADRWNPFDERHLGGARQDNRVLPYGIYFWYILRPPLTRYTEGCLVSEFPPASQDSIINLFLAFNEYYPESVLQHRLALFKKHLNETYFAWIGEFGDEDPYYYRIHSPVAFMELDFHCGSKSYNSLFAYL
ncbi:Uncharacterized protein BP5553_04407 [Venustampulla echinocandica]|uniref:Uncharacterized protein n=1 Tax=Venustampulla echinocandica TaxID=2656787 RepID=A0A370TN81_9HELO|nr:Uncharacterized protein BP5553_04407 [Venustampulla echinocandica]RDL36974.1 Uncharacterized protein BP5553_04407 [Venustampulla echinocandica]